VSPFPHIHTEPSRPRRDVPTATRNVIRVGACAGLGALALWGLSSSADAAPQLVTAVVKSAELRVTGTGSADSITVRVSSLDPNKIEVDADSNGTAEFAFDRQRFTRITVSGGAGADRLTLQPSNDAFTSTELTTLNGDAGNDILIGANGPETLNGGDDADLIDGNVGADKVSLGAGADTFQWDPGDASDTVDGGTGTDRLSFNGANVSEAFAFTASGDHARLTRNIGTVATDLVGVERVELRALGGADTLTTSNLAGTHLRAIEIDLAAAGGADDLQADVVTVGPTVTVSGEAAVGVIKGLGAEVRVVNGSITDRIQVIGTTGVDTLKVAGTPGPDAVNASAAGTEVAVTGASGSVLTFASGVETIDVDLSAGDDQFSATGNLAALTALDVDGGAGADTLLGGNGADTLVGGAGADFLDANQGIDVVRGGSEADVFQWDPGDGNDVLDGGDGGDRLVFNGSGIAETFDISSVGDHVRLARNIGVISLDLDQIESIDLRSFAGADWIAVHDLAGTDLATVNADLAAAVGGDDGAIDSVVTRSGVVVGGEGPVGVIDGLGAQVRVVNGAASDQIRIIGGPEVDVVTIAGTQGADVGSAIANGTEPVFSGFSGSVLTSLSAVETAEVELGDGDDRFSAVGNLSGMVTLDVRGGDGADTLLGGNGSDIIDGGPGVDFIDGNQGADSLFGGAADDTFQWDPGDGSDLLDGGEASDRLIFNGSGASERIAVGADSSSVVLTRDVAGIVLHMALVETLDVRTFAGTDVVTVDDLTGTDMLDVGVDLRSNTGVDDLQIDDVIVNATAGDDHVSVSTFGAAVLVGGLHTDLYVIPASQTQDRLTVNGLDGDDAVDATPEAAGMMTLVLLP
jgi:Ca2+-binding RTX toxin-like protein